MGRKFLCLFLGGLTLAASARGADFRFRLYGGASYVDGADLNKNISSWDSYHWDRRNPAFKSQYNLGEMHVTTELGAEAVWQISRRWSLSLAAGSVFREESGLIFTRSLWQEDPTNSFPEPWVVDSEETTEQRPRYTWLTIPVTLSLDYAVATGARWTLTVGAGGGVYWGRLDLQEPYNITSRSVAEGPTESGVVQYIDDLRTTGEYSEKLTGTGFGLHGRLGFEYRLSRSVYLAVSVLGRWVNMKGWEGSRRDASEWQWSYGLWGASYATGSDERTESGQLWTEELHDDLTGKSYPILVFAGTAPSAESQPANISLTGISVRVGLGFRFGSGN